MSSIVIHHKPSNPNLPWRLYAWQNAWDGNKYANVAGTRNGDVIDFQFPDFDDLRKVQFKYHYAKLIDFWESDDFTRRFFQVPKAEAWTFEATPRVVYTQPGAQIAAEQSITISAISQSQFGGGKIYAWNAYDTSAPAIEFDETSRDEAQGISTFAITLASWMSGGFNFKLVKPTQADPSAEWEPNSSNRIWCPSDGLSPWIKSGKCDLRPTKFQLQPTRLEVLYSAILAEPPLLSLIDVAENQSLDVIATSCSPYPGNNFFKVAQYSVPIYPGAAYLISAKNSLEGQTFQRPFPADPANTAVVSRFILGKEDWVATFPTFRQIPLSITPVSPSSFEQGLSVQLAIGNGPTYETLSAARQPDGTWQCQITIANDIAASIVLNPQSGQEPKPYDQLDTRRNFTPSATTTTIYTTEGVYGACSTRATTFAEPADRSALMASVYGQAIISAQIFSGHEMPLGATICGTDVHFVVHAPHAVCASLVLVNESATPVTRQLISMNLSADNLYWWCQVPLTQAPANTRYRFLLNDSLEVLDPAAKAVCDRLTDVQFNQSPADLTTSWSVVLDAEAVKITANSAPWLALGWDKFLIYEIHPHRFTDIQATTLSSFDLLVDELTQPCRRGVAGYLSQLPATVFGVMPVSEFSSKFSWGYNPSYYFAIGNVYGGAMGLARFVKAAHESGRGVTLDLVYNHSNDSSLMKIAADVYRGDIHNDFGDGMNCGHPMVQEFFRQATVYLYQTFNLDGFRFDDTHDIIVSSPGAWDLLAKLRSALRSAADADGRKWPYCVAENQGANAWDVSAPSSGVLDGQWGIDEGYQVRSACYDSWTSTQDSASALKEAMDQPQYFGRPFYQVARYGETHDMVSGQDPGNKRIAARPPFGQGLQMAKAMGALTLLSNGVPLIFMGQEVGATDIFSFDHDDQCVNPQLCDPPALPTQQTRVLAWFRQLMGLRNDFTKGLQGDQNYQVVATGQRTIAFTCGYALFAIISFGTTNNKQNTADLGLPDGGAYKEIFNSSWPDFQVENENEQANGGYDAQITRGQDINVPFVGAVVLERR